MTDKPPTDNAEGETKRREEGLELPDLNSMVSLARSSEDHEAYRVVSAHEHFRVGFVVNSPPDTPTTFRIEVLLQILAKDTQPRIADLERMNDVLEGLTKRGYSLDHHDGCWVTCERELALDDIQEECLAVLAILSNVGEV